MKPLPELSSPGVRKDCYIMKPLPELSSSGVRKKRYIMKPLPELSSSGVRKKCHIVKTLPELPSSGVRKKRYIVKNLPELSTPFHHESTIFNMKSQPRRPCIMRRTSIDRHTTEIRMPHVNNTCLLHMVSPLRPRRFS